MARYYSFFSELFLGLFSSHTFLTVFFSLKTGCTMYETPLFYDLSETTGVMGSPREFTRMHINGGFMRYFYKISNSHTFFPTFFLTYFFRYMMLVWSGSKDWIKRFVPIINRRCIHQPSETSGILWKAQGNPGNVVEGPYGKGDFGYVVRELFRQGFFGVFFLD